MWIYFILGVFFIVLGLAVHVFKWYFLISGYNTMSKEEKEKVDTKGLGRLMGIYCYTNGGILLLTGFLTAIGLKPTLTPALIYLGISTVYLLVKAQKFDGNNYDENGRMRKGIWKHFIVPFVILIIVGVLLFSMAQPTEVSVNDKGIKIHGLYGETYTWDSIEDVKLIEKLPTIERRINGAQIGAYLKGYFRTREYGTIKLFANTKKPPFVYLKTDDRIAIFNLGTENETQEIFKELEVNIK